MTAIPLAGGPEFDRIRAIARALGSRARGLGDDTAFVTLGENTLALSTDVSVEGVHFRRDWLTLEEIGWRAAAAALSDLAAAGADALGLLVALTVPAAEETESLVAIMEGAGAAIASAGGAVLGGDLSRGEFIAIAVTVVGTTRRPVRRHGAEAGDGIWVTGDLGGARAALAAFTDHRRPDATARARFARPTLRLEAGRWLAAHGAKAMLDLSDGLAGDAAHLAAASDVSLRIELERLPLHPAVPAEAKRAGRAPALFAAEGGEDYELLVALPPEFDSEGGNGSDFPLTRIGEVMVGAGLTLLFEGRPVQVAGYDHFA